MCLEVFGFLNGSEKGLVRRKKYVSDTEGKIIRE